MADLYILRNALLDLARPARLLVCGLLVLAPAGVALLIRGVGRGSFDGIATYDTLAALLVFGFVLVILSVVFGTGVITREIEQKTIVYLLTRPIARWRILLMKYLAAALAVTVTVEVSVLLLAAATTAPREVSGAVEVRAVSLRDRAQFVKALQFPPNSVMQLVRDNLSEQTLRDVDGWNSGGILRRGLVRGVLRDVNRLINGPLIYTEATFGNVQLQDDTRRLMSAKPRGVALRRANRWLLEDGLPDYLYRSRTTGMRLGRDLLILPIGALAYTALFLLLAALIRRALIAGLLFAFGWESWVPMTSGKFQMLSIMSYLRTLAPHAKVDAASVDLTFLLQMLTPEAIPVRVAWGALTGIIVVGLGTALLVFSLKEYVPGEGDG